MSQRKFLVIADDSPEFQAALRFACRRARSTGGHVALLRVIEPAVLGARNPRPCGAKATSR